MTTQFDPSEFTEPFCIERFRNGEPALMSCSEFAKFAREDDGIIRTNRGVFIAVAMFADGESSANKWRMRPAQDGWIKHDGVENCPIPWAKAGEYEAKQGNSILSSHDPKEYYWDVITAYRLTDGWVPVKSGECPKLPGSGPWEIKCRSGANKMSNTNHNYVHQSWWIHSNQDADIVAVRRVPSQPAKSIDIDDYVELISMNPEVKQALEEGRQWVQETFYTEQIKHQLDGIDADIREIFNISSIIGQAFFDARTDKRTIGPVVECPVIARLMK